MKKRIAETISVPQLYKLFPDDKACREWLEEMRWGGEPVCPHCGAVEDIKPSGETKPNHYWCKSCRKDFTVTTGTCMHSTKKPLQDWLYTFYAVLTGRKGVSAMQLSKELGVQYRTAWHMLHRVREACKGGDFMLSNIVEVDETYKGGKERNKHESKKRKAGRGTAGKKAIIGARERGGKVVAQPLEVTDSRSLVEFVETHTEPGATVYTDDASAYNALPSKYKHESVRHSAGEYVRGDVHTNSIESVWSVFKRSLNRHVASRVQQASRPLRQRGGFQAQRGQLRSGYSRPDGGPGEGHGREEAALQRPNRVMPGESRMTENDETRAIGEVMRDFRDETKRLPVSRVSVRQ